MHLPKHLLTVLTGLLLACSSPMWAKNEKMKLGDVEYEPVKKKKHLPAEREPTPEERKQMLENVVSEFYQKGLTSMRAGKWEEARSYLRRTIVLQPSHTDAINKLDVVNQKIEQKTPLPVKQTQDPKVLLLEKLNTDMTRSILEKDWQTAHNTAKKILAIEPNHSNAKKRLNDIEETLFQQAMLRGEAKEKAGDIQSAVDAYQVALNYRQKASVEEKIAHLQSKLAQGNKRKSEDIYLKALKASQEGNRDKALQLCQQALRIDPGNLQARRMQERLRGKR